MKAEFAEVMSGDADAPIPRSAEFFRKFLREFFMREKFRVRLFF